MTQQNSSAPQVKGLLSGLSDQGSQHLTELETDLVQTNILLSEAIEKLSASFMAIHEAVSTQQDMMETLLADASISPAARLELKGKSEQIGLHINSAVTGLQFQDMTNQLISRITRRIVGLRDVLSVVGAGSSSIPVAADNNEMIAVLAEINEALTTQSRLLENELWKAVCQTHMESGDIELF